MDALLSQRATRNRLKPLFVGLGLALLSLGLAWVSAGFRNLDGWFSFLLIFLLAAGLLAGGWWLVRHESPPRWLMGLLIGAALLRLAAGVVWSFVLPVAGYNSPPEQRGYVMSDAYDRDRTAWDLARSDKSLWKAFQGTYRKADQYGGLLFLSAAIYRYTAGEVHQPLLMVVLTAAFSSLAILFTWGFARHLWGEAAAILAAWTLALYPEAVLLGSSQMREAFTITLAIGASYGLVRYAQDRGWGGLALVVGALVLCLPLSPPTAALLLIVLIIQAAGMGRGLLPESLRAQRWFWPAIVGVVVLVAIGLWLALSQFAPQSVTSPLGVVAYWARKSADWNAYLSERASGWMQKIFDSTPGWAHAPMLVLYGIVQPFLPAALIDGTGALIWRLIAIWRAVGWALLLPLLAYAPLRALRKGWPERALSLAVWLAILASSFRSGGDAWDNPRYRLTFAGIQIALAAWIWSEQRRAPDPWLRRVLVGAGLVLLWFVPWYLRRYTHFTWPVVDIFKTLGLGVASAVLFWIGDVAREAAKKQPLS